MRTESYQDQWPSGNPMNVVAHFDEGGNQPPVVAFTLPNGDRLVSTGVDYNRSMQFISRDEAGWRNAINAKRRKALGIADENDQQISAEFDKTWLEFKKDGSKFAK